MNSRESVAPATTLKVGPSPWPTFTLCAVASYITTLDLSVVNVAFAEIAKSFPGVSRTGLSWVVTSYSIVFGSLLVVSGQAADRIGRKRIFLAGAVLFLIGSVVCGAASSLELLISGRVIQGIGGALFVPASTGLLLAAFEPERRTQAIAWIGGLSALGVASGPTLGAFMVSTYGWRAAFWINIPVCVAALIAGQRVLRESPRGEAKPDIFGAALFTASVAALVLAISEGQSWGWFGARVLGLIASSAILLIAVVQRSRGRTHPALPIDLFRERTFSAANVGSLLFGAAFAGMALNNVLFLRNIWGYSVVRAGWFSVLSPLVVAVVAAIIGKRAKQHGVRGLLVIGPILFAVTEAAFASVLSATPTPWTRWLPLAVVLGASIGLTFPALSATAVMGLPQAKFAVGSAVNNTFRQVGSALGVAFVVAIQTATAGIDGYRWAWWFCGAAGALAAVVAIGALRTRAQDGSRSHPVRNNDAQRARPRNAAS